MIKIIISLLVVLAVLVAGYLFAQPYLAAMDMKAAADARDAQALSSHIDFESVRESVKLQVRGRVESKAGAKAGAPLGALAAALTAPVSDRIVEAIIAPESLVAIFDGEVPDKAGQIQRDEASDGSQSGQDAAAAESKKNLSFGYTAVDRFEIDVTNEDGEITQFVLGRRGLSWKLIEVYLPSLSRS